MKIIDIRNLSKKENFLHYRNEYSGSLVYQIGSSEEESGLEFSLERTATGQREIAVTFPESIHYPLIPAIRKVKEYVVNMDDRGELL